MTQPMDSQIVSGIHCPVVDAFAGPDSSGDLTEVLFEQLEYLVQFSDQERDRLNRVKAILLETFN